MPFLAWHTEVRVEDPAGRPIQGAIVTGGIDWDHFEEVTNRSGAARVPRDQLGDPARILAADHFPLAVTSLQSRAYVLHPTARRLRSLGRIQGQVLRMSTEEVLTFDPHHGFLHYRIRADSVVQESAAALTPRPDLSGEVHLFGDELWLSRSNLNAVEIWSVADPASPRWLRRIEGFRSVLARRDSLLVVAQQRPAESSNHVEIWSLSAEHTARKLSELPVPIPAARFVGDALYVLPRGDLLGVRDLKVVSLRDPQHPQIVRRLDLPEHVHVSFSGDRAILTPRSVDPESGAHHPVLDLSDPFHPKPAGHLHGNGYLIQALEGGWAFGFTPDPRVASLLEIRGDRITVVATTTAETAHVWPYPSLLPGGGAAQPYYAFAERVWRLEN